MSFFGWREGTVSLGSVVRRRSTRVRRFNAKMESSACFEPATWRIFMFRPPLRKGRRTGTGGWLCPACIIGAPPALPWLVLVYSHPFWSRYPPKYTCCRINWCSVRTRRPAGRVPAGPRSGDVPPPRIRAARWSPPFMTTPSVTRTKTSGGGRLLRLY